MEGYVKLSKAGDIAMLQADPWKQSIFRLIEGAEIQTHKGTIYHNDLIGTAWGSTVSSHLGSDFLLIEPSLRDLLLHLPRQSQIIFPKDLGYILLRLSIGPGSRVIEAGTGSGALTTAMAWYVGDQGHIFTYDRREDMVNLARKNLTRLGLEDRVSIQLQDLAEGCDEENLDAAFLDLPKPEEYLGILRKSLSSGAIFGAILPTTNQVSILIPALEDHGFGSIEIAEILLRFYKPKADRLRPVDRMVAHTGYLIFARAIVR
jgi:tRNA (adenine57-N1/adenine58-N1)-methyltransferase